MNRRMTAAQVLQLVRRAARKRGCRVERLSGRGKGSHQIHVLLEDDREIGRFSITDHGSKDVSWGVLRQIEEGLSGLLGEKWMEKG